MSSESLSYGGGAEQDNAHVLGLVKSVGTAKITVASVGVVNLTAASESVEVIAKDVTSIGVMGILIKALLFIRSSGAFGRLSGTSSLKLGICVVSTPWWVTFTADRRLFREAVST